LGPGGGVTPVPPPTANVCDAVWTKSYSVASCAAPAGNVNGWPGTPPDTAASSALLFGVVRSSFRTGALNVLPNSHLPAAADAHPVKPALPDGGAWHPAALQLVDTIGSTPVVNLLTSYG